MIGIQLQPYCKYSIFQFYFFSRLCQSNFILSAPLPWDLSGKFLCKLKVYFHETFTFGDINLTFWFRSRLLNRLPNVGKSSLTNLLAGDNHAEAANYPFCTVSNEVVFVYLFCALLY